MDKEFETGDGIEAIPDVGPNVSHEEDSFFESDHSIESKLRRQKKKVTVEHLGAPFKCPSKVLAMCPSSHFSNQIYVAESGHITRLVRLKVFFRWGFESFRLARMVWLLMFVGWKDDAHVSRSQGTCDLSCRTPCKHNWASS